jgi:rhodanese-related sulfurtransferase
MVSAMPVTDLAAAVQRGERVVDVRERHEFISGHITGAEHIPMAIVPLHVNDFSRTKPVWLVCETGNRSWQVADYLTRHGFSALTVNGGTSAWRASGMPVTQGVSV